MRSYEAQPRLDTADDNGAHVQITTELCGGKFLYAAITVLEFGVVERIGGLFARLKKNPVRAHPGAPDKPPFETFAGLMAAPLDKLKDMFAKFPTDEQKQAAKD